MFEGWRPHIAGSETLYRQNPIGPIPLAHLLPLLGVERWILCQCLCGRGVFHSMYPPLHKPLCCTCVIMCRILSTRNASSHLYTTESAVGSMIDSPPKPSSVRFLTRDHTSRTFRILPLSPRGRKVPGWAPGVGTSFIMSVFDARAYNLFSGTTMVSTPHFTSVHSRELPQCEGWPV